MERALCVGVHGSWLVQRAGDGRPPPGRVRILSGPDRALARFDAEPLTQPRRQAVRVGAHCDRQGVRAPSGPEPARHGAATVQGGGVGPRVLADIETLLLANLHAVLSKSLFVWR